MNMMKIIERKRWNLTNDMMDRITKPQSVIEGDCRKTVIVIENWFNVGNR